jgi:hypothetical protein
MTTTAITVAALLALASACFGQDKTAPIAIDCIFKNTDEVQLHLHGYSNTRVAPEKIAIWPYSRPMMDPTAFSANWIVIGTGFGHITKRTNRRELGDKLRKVASDHGANCIAYEISGNEFRVRFVRLRDETFKKDVTWPK